MTINLNSKFLAPTGRMAVFLKDPSRGVLPASCTVNMLRHPSSKDELLYEVLPDLINFTFVALMGGAGVNLHLDGWMHIDIEKPGKLYIGERPPGVTSFSVQDSMLDDPKEAGDLSIVSAVPFVISYLASGRDLHLDLSNIRPEGTVGSKGQVGSGPNSFAVIYRAAEALVHDWSLKNFLSLLSVINQNVRRGGVFKNGALTTSYPYWGRHILEYLGTNPVIDHPWVRRGIVFASDSVGSNLELDTQIFGLAEDGSLWYEKALSALDNKTWLTTKQAKNPAQYSRLLHNVCLPAGTLVRTRQGDFPIESLAGQDVETWNGASWEVSHFKQYGEASEFIRVTLENGITLDTTLDHRWILADGSETYAKDLQVGVEVAHHLDIGEATSSFYVKSVEQVTLPLQPVYSAQSPSSAYTLSVSIYTGNCREVMLEPRGTCILLPINAGQIETPDQIPEAMCQGMQALCDFHAADTMSAAGVFLPADQDRQVGLGWIGFANMLALAGLTYAEFTEEFENQLDHIERVYGIDGLTAFLHDALPIIPYDDPNRPVTKWVSSLIKGYADSSLIAKDAGMSRAYAIAPTASVSYRYKDHWGNTTAPEIAPPLSQTVDRLSDTETDLGEHLYDYGFVETAQEVGFSVYLRLADCFQRVMDMTGMGHAISLNVWEPMDFGQYECWAGSSLKSTYYRIPVDTGYADKSAQLGTDACIIYPLEK